jgi:hypothetical protein
MPALAAWLLLIPLVLLCCIRPAARVFSAAGRGLDGVGRVPAGPEALVLLAALTIGAVPMMLGVVHPPSTHDEFAYLLAADTFVKGRLTNPTHPLWEHFETFHQIMQPTYMSKFPPGQGMALAAGMWLGAPIVGAWGTIALACAAICWMLRAWLPDRWAIAGGLVAAFHPLIFWWGQIYWGGGVALLGGAVLSGAFARAMEEPRTRWGILAGIGMAILANSRPFEGALLSIILLGVLSIDAIRGGRRATLARRIILPIVLVLLPVAGWMMYYNARVTGEPLTMPYVVHARQYMISPLLWLQSPPPPPSYRHAKLAQYYTGYEFQEYSRQASLWGFFEHGLAAKVVDIARQWLNPPTLAIALLALPLVAFTRGIDTRQRRAARICAGVCLGFPVLHMMLTPWLRMQYLAPVGGLFFAAAALSLWQMSKPRTSGWTAALARAILAMQFIAVAWLIVQMVQNPHPPGLARARLLEDLRSRPGDHLVIVRYSDAPQLMFEWVYNKAEIDESRIVFAHFISEVAAKRLLDYYPERQAWLLSIDGMRYDRRAIE